MGLGAAGIRDPALRESERERERERAREREKERGRERERERERAREREKEARHACSRAGHFQGLSKRGVPVSSQSAAHLDKS